MDLILGRMRYSNAMIEIMNGIRKRKCKFPQNVEIGEYTYGMPTIYMYTDKNKVKIGRFCSIANDVSIIANPGHMTNWISTYPFWHFIPEIRSKPDVSDIKGDTIIGNDVWIGMHVIILPGVKIGDGAVIGAGSIVTKDVHNYEVVAGSPASHIRFRFTEKDIEKLMKIKWWNWPLEKIISNVTILQSSNISALEEIIDN